MQDKLEEIIREKRNGLATEKSNMDSNAPDSARDFANGYIYAMQELIVFIEQRKLIDSAPEYFKTKFMPK